jgi:hypothetical protein
MPVSYFPLTHNIEGVRGLTVIASGSTRYVAFASASPDASRHPAPKSAFVFFKGCLALFSSRQKDLVLVVHVSAGAAAPTAALRARVSHCMRPLAHQKNTAVPIVQMAYLCY